MNQHAKKEIDRRGGQLMARGKQNDIINKDVQSTTDTISVSVYKNNQEREDAILFKQLSESFKCIIWWINRSLAYIRPYRGVCTRKTVFSGEVEKKYYNPGKIFRFQNIISATKGDGTDNNEFNKDSTLWFHIYSQTGRRVNEFTGSQSDMETQADTILFKQG